MIYRIKNCRRIKTLFFSILLFVEIIVLEAQETRYNSKSIDSVFSELKNQLNKTKKGNDSIGIINSYIQLGIFYENLGIVNEATKNFHLALKLNKVNDTTTVYIENKIGAIHLSLKQYETATSYLNESLEIVKQIGFEKGEATCYALLGSVAEKQSNYNLALKYQKRSLSIFKKLSDNTGLAIVNENIGSIYEDLEQFEDALNFFLRAHDFAKNSPSNNRINIINNLGDANRKMGKTKEALSYTQLAYEISKATYNRHEEAAAVKDLALTYADLGDFKKAFVYMEEHSNITKRETERKNSELVSTLQILYEVEERQAQVELLSKQNEINKIRQNIILLASTFLILVLIIWLLYYKKQQQQQSKIHQYEQQLLQANLDRKTDEETALQREIGIKISSLTNYSLHLAHKNKMLSDISRTLFNLKDRNTVMIKSKLEALIKDIDFDLSQEREWTEFIGFFEQIHPNFFQILKNSVSIELSPSELRLCMLLRLNLSSKEIASILKITPDSVRIARYRLRKKLPVNPKDDLQIFILNL